MGAKLESRAHRRGEPILERSVRRYSGVTTLGSRVRGNDDQTVSPAEAGIQRRWGGATTPGSRVRGNDDQTVIPAEAGIQRRWGGATTLGSRVRGNDGLQTGTTDQTGTT